MQDPAGKEGEQVERKQHNDLPAGGTDKLCSWTGKRPDGLEQTICPVFVISKVPLSDYAKQKDKYVDLMNIYKCERDRIRFALLSHHMSVTVDAEIIQ